MSDTTANQVSELEIPSPADSEIITASAGSDGSIEPSGTVMVALGEDQTFLIHPAEGFSVKDVLVDGASEGAVSTYTFHDVQAAHTIEVSFEATPVSEPETFTVTIRKQGEGTGTLSQSTQEVAYGNSLTVSATPDASSEFAGWSGDASGSGDAKLTNITSDKEIIASFKLKTFTITPEVKGANGGSIEPSDPVSVTYGGTASFAIKKPAGYHIEALRVDGNSVDVSGTYTFDDVRADHTLEAEFANDALVISAIALQSIFEDGIGSVSFTVEHTEMLARSLTVTAKSSAPGIVRVGPPDCQEDDQEYTLTLKPAENAFGDATITVTATDGVNTASQSFDLVIIPVNDPPFFVKGPDQKVGENSGSHVIPKWATFIISGPENESEQSLEFHVSTDNDGLFAELPAISANGTLTYTIAKDSNGAANVEVYLKDNGGVENGGTGISEVQTFAITVSELPIIGDADGDGKVGLSDALLVIQQLSEQADDESEFGIEDLIYALRIASGLE